MKLSKEHSKFEFEESNTAGFSIISVIVSIGLAGVSVYGVTSGFVALRKTQGNTAVKASFQVVQPAIRTALARAARDFVFEKKCGDNTKSFSERIDQSFKDVPILSVNGSGSAKMTAVTSVTPPHSRFSDASTRCAGQRIRNYNYYGTGAGSLAYTCLSLSAATTFKEKLLTSGQSFWSLNNTFLEVLVLPVDLRRDEPLTCLTADSPGAGLKILYTVYYAANQGSGDGANRADGVFYVTRE